MAAKRKKVPDGVRLVNIQGVSCPIRKVPTHSANPAIDMAMPLTGVGYISESNTQITAEIEMAQQNIYNKKKISNVTDGRFHDACFMK